VILMWFSLKKSKEESYMNKNFKREMDCFIDKYYDENKNSGCLRVTLKDEVIYKKFFGYADIENKVEFTDKSMFTLYSLSKPFCVLGLMKLKDKGLVDIDAHPGKYLCEAKGFGKSLTLRHLMQHISGVPDFDQNTDFRTKYQGETSEELRMQLPLLAKKGMLFSPGTKHHYTNTNFIICALIIENVSGMSYAEYMKKEVFTPLGMHDTYIDNKNLILKDRVKGYKKDADDIVCTERATGWALGGADVISTTDDVYCLNKAIKCKLLLTEESWDEILTPHQLNSMGLGCTITKWHGLLRITHNGGWHGFRTLHIQLPEKDFDIIFLSNSAWGDARNDIANAVYNTYYGDDGSGGNIIKMDVGYIK